MNELIIDAPPATLGTVPTADHLVAAMQELLASAMQFISCDGEGASTRRVAQAVNDLRTLRAQSDMASRYRPETNRARATSKALAELEAVWGEYALACAAASPGESQYHAALAQRTLDAATSDLSAFTRLARATEILEDSRRTYFDRIISALDEIDPEVSLLEVAELGAVEVRSFVQVGVDPGHGVQFQLLDLIARTKLDPIRFRTVVQQASLLCVSNDELLRLADEEDAVNGLINASRLLTASLHEHELLFQSPRPDEMVLRRILKMHAEIYEDVTAPLMVWCLRLASVKQQSYRKLRDSGATALARRVIADPRLSRWFAGLEPGFRNAASHTHGFDLEGASVQFDLETYNANVPLMEVLDTVLANLESVAAVLWSLSNGLTNIGRGLPIDPDIEYYGVTPERIAAWWLRQTGASVLSATPKDGVFEIRLEAELAQTRMTALAIAETLEAPVHITVEGFNGPTLHVPRSSWRRFARSAGSEPVDYAMALMRLLMECNHDEEPTLGDADLRWFAACAGIYFLSGDLSAGRRLQEAKHRAVIAGLKAVVDSVAETQRVFRLNDKSTTATRIQQLQEEVVSLPEPKLPEGANVLID